MSDGISRPTEEAALSVVYAEQKLARLKNHRPIDRLTWLMRMSGYGSAEVGRLIGRSQQAVSWQYTGITREMMRD